MNRKTINILLIAIVLLNVFDDASAFAVLDIIKYILLILCFYLNNRKD